MSVASAVPCDAEALTDLLLPPAEAAAVRLDRTPEEAAELVALDVALLVERCAQDRAFLRRIGELETQARAVQDRASLFLLGGHPSTWTADTPRTADTATVDVPQVLALTWTGADASASLDLLGTERLRISVRRGPPPPPPKPPTNRREARTWTPPPEPVVQYSTEVPPVWTASCWGPAAVEPLMQAMCASIVAAPDDSWVATAIPGTPFALTGPPNPRVDDFRTLVWPDAGVTAQVWVYLQSEQAEAHAANTTMHAWAPGSSTVLVTCTADLPDAQLTAQQICDSFAAADDMAVERLMRLDMRRDQALDGVVSE